MVRFPDDFFFNAVFKYATLQQQEETEGRLKTEANLPQNISPYIFCCRYLKIAAKSIGEKLHLIDLSCSRHAGRQKF